MKKPSFRVFFCVHDGGRLTGLLLRTRSLFFDHPLPSAFGADEEAVLDGLEGEIARLQTDDPEALNRYMWDEELSTRAIRLDIPPLSAAHGRLVIGKRRVPLLLTYAYSEMEGGGYRVIVPRFDAQLVLEDLSLVDEVLRPFLTNLLVGEDPRTLFDLRSDVRDYVRAFTPRTMRRRGAKLVPSAYDDYATVRQVADELVAQARGGKLPTIVGLPEGLQKLRDAPQLVPPSVMLVGPPGVGKTAWVHALAQRWAAPSELQEASSRKLWSTSGDRILSGLPYLGQWQQRCLKLVQDLEHTGDALYIGHISSIVESQYEGSAIADFFDGSLAEGSVTLIGEATPEEYARARRQRASFLSRFDIVHLAEPPSAECIELLRAYAERLPGPRLHASSYRRLLRHLEVFGRESALPGKGLRFLDWLARTRSTAHGDILYPADVSRAFADFASIPYVLLADDEPMGPEDFANQLSARVIGQREACGVAGRVLSRLKSAMTPPARPAATLLFVGPTGVGKSELAKQLARAAFGTDQRLIRFDMSEFMWAGSASRLLDPSKGARSLVNRIREEPRALVLLDEIEKAHPDVLDLLLGALDEGRLSDARGRAADLCGAIIVLTSNLGVRTRPSVGFGEDDRETSLGEVRAHFRPELFHRIDYVVPFRALHRNDIERIVELELGYVSERAGLVARNIRLVTSSAAIARLTELGYDPLYGARPLRRAIEERVVAPLSARLSSEPSLRDLTVRVITDTEPASGVCVVL